MLFPGIWYPALWQFVVTSTIANCPRRHFLCGSTLIAHEKCQEGSKGGNGFFHVRWVLPVVESKAILNHFRLVNLQAASGGGVRRNKENPLTINAPDSPSPKRNRQDP